MCFKNFVYFNVLSMLYLYLIYLLFCCILTQSLTYGSVPDYDWLDTQFAEMVPEVNSWILKVYCIFVLLIILFGVSYTLESAAKCC